MNLKLNFVFAARMSFNIVVLLVYMIGFNIFCLCFKFILDNLKSIFEILNTGEEIPKSEIRKTESNSKIRSHVDYS